MKYDDGNHDVCYVSFRISESKGVGHTKSEVNHRITIDLGLSDPKIPNEGSRKCTRGKLAYTCPNIQLEVAICDHHIHVFDGMGIIRVLQLLPTHPVAFGSSHS